MFISPSEYWRPGMGMTAFVHLLPASSSCRHALCGLCQTLHQESKPSPPSLVPSVKCYSIKKDLPKCGQPPPKVGGSTPREGRSLEQTLSPSPSLPLLLPAAESHISPPSPFICYSTLLWPRDNGPSRPRTWTRSLKPFL